MVKTKTINNLKINFIITLILTIFTFLMNSVFSKYMGKEILGIMRLFSQMMVIFSFAELGLGSAASFALYKPLAENDEESINRVYSTLNNFYRKVTIVVFVLGVFSNFILNFFIDTHKIVVYLYWNLYIVSTTINYIYAKYTILFTADQEFGFVRKVQGITKMLIQIAQIISVIYFNNFIIFILLLGVENMVNWFIYYKKFRKKYFDIIIDRRTFDLSIIKDTKNLLVHKVSQIVVFNTNYLIIGKFLSLELVAIYASYMIVYQGIKTIVSILTNAFAPDIGNFIAVNPVEKVYEYWKKQFIIYSFIASILVTVTYVVIQDFITLWVGKDYLLSKVTIILLIFNLYIDLVRGVTENFKNGFGFFDDIHLPVIEAILNLILTITLVRKIGINGILIGTLVTNILVIYLWKTLLVAKRYFNVRLITFSKDYFGVTFISLVSFYLLSKTYNKVESTTWINWVIYGAIYFIGSLFVNIIFFSIFKEFRCLVRSTFFNIKNKKRG